MERNYSNHACIFCTNPTLNHSNYENENCTPGSQESTNKDKEQVGISQDQKLINTFFQLTQTYFAGRNLSGRKVRPVVDNLSCCEACIHFLKSIIQLYMELECVQMKINWKLDSLYKIMECTNETPEVLPKSRLSGEQQAFQKSWEQLEKYRKAFMSKSSDHLTKFAAKVVLEKSHQTAHFNTQNNQFKGGEDIIIPKGHLADLQTEYLWESEEYDPLSLPEPEENIIPFPSQSPDHVIKSSSQESLVEVEASTHETGEISGCSQVEMKIEIGQVESCPFPIAVKVAPPSPNQSNEANKHGTDIDIGKLETTCQPQIVQSKATLPPVRRHQARLKSHKESVESDGDSSLKSEDECESEQDDDDDLLEQESSSSQSETESSVEMESRMAKKKKRKQVESKDLEKAYKCSECPATYDKQYYLSLHTKKVHLLSTKVKDSVITNEGFTIKQWVHKIGASFKCNVEQCSKMFMTQGCLDDHSKLHGTFPCNFCEEVKHFAKDLALHEFHHHSNINCDGENTKKEEQCPRCSYKLPTAFHRKTNVGRYVSHHLQVHLHVLVDGLRCPICKSLLLVKDKPQRMANLMEHYLVQHQVLDDNWEKVIKCPESGCRAYFLTDAQFEDHHAVFHVRGEFKFVCKDCGIKFREKRYLHDHRRKKHLHILKNLDKFECKVEGCRKMYECQLDLDRHLNVSHSGKWDSPCACTICGKQFRANRYLVQHMVIHDSNVQTAKKLANVCDQCGKSFKSRQLLEMHSRIHGGPQSWNYCCSVCKKKCISNGKLKEHMRTHSSERSFVCQICGGSYAHRHNLRSHMERVHGDKKPEPFVCQVCGTQYAFKHNLRNHMKSKHQQQ